MPCLQCVGPALDLGSGHKKARRSGGPGDGGSQYNDHGHHMQRLFLIKGDAYVILLPLDLGLQEYYRAIGSRSGAVGPVMGIALA